MKGQSKALEIVLVLLVLVIVTYVVLQIFNKYISQGTQSFENIQISEQQRMEADKVVELCKEKCNRYLSSNSEKDLVEFCSTFVELDLNGDGDKNDYVEKSALPSISLGGIGTCEERIPCFLVYECKSGGKGIDGKRCEEAICHYFGELGVSGSKLNARLNELLDPGECYDKFLPYHWFSLSFEKKDRGGLQCP